MSFYEEFQTEVDKLEFCRGEALLQQINRVIAVAEKHGDLDAAAEWYQALLRVAEQQGRFDYELSAFSSLRKLYDTQAKFKDLRGMILWYFKWIVDRLPEHVEISLDMVETVFGQMTEFYKAEGESLRPVYSLRCRCYAFLGHKEEAERYYDLWQETDAGTSDDCPACQTDSRVYYLLGLGRAEEAIEAAAPIISGEQRCDEVPTITFSRLLMPLTMDGKVELADRMHQVTVRAVRSTPKFAPHLGQHVVFLTLTGRSMAASRLAKLALGHGTKLPNSYHRLASWRAGWLWLGMLRHEGETAVQLPAGVFPEYAGQLMPIDEAIERCRGEAYALAEAFDRRAGAEQFLPSMNGLQQLLENLPKTGSSEA